MKEALGWVAAPNHSRWPSKRARYLFRERREKAWLDDVQLTASQEFGVISQQKYQDLSGNRVTAALAGTESFQHVHEGDFVISLRTFEGGIEYAFERGCISPAYTVLRPSNEVEAGFFRYVLKSSAFLSALQTTVTGIRDGKSVKYKDFADVMLQIPDRRTQKCVADFLDHETGSLDRLIEKKQKVVELLLEKRKITAHKCLMAGARGLEVDRRVGTVVSFMTSGSRGWSGLLGSEGELFVQSGNIGRHMNVDLQSVQRVQPQNGPEADRTLVRSHDVLVCITGGRTGAVGFIDSIDERAYINQHICLLRARQDVIQPRLLAHILWSEIGQIQIEMCQYGVKQGLGFSQVADLKIPVPPRNLQERITADMDRIVGRIDDTSRLVEQSINLLTELRTSLITAAVTGQIDVDNWRKASHTDRRIEAIHREVGE